MADFRKWLFAFAVVALLFVAGTPAHAQVVSNNAVTCTANAANPPIVRGEGVTELVGDIVLQCVGGTSTGTGLAIPTSNIQIFLNTNVTSRLMSSTTQASEALLLVDEPYPTTPNPSTVTIPTPAPAAQGYCPFPYAGNNCVPIGTNGGVGNGGPYHTFNVFQGIQNSVNSVAWLGVPVDAPGTNAVRTLRFTNIRANACLLGVSSTLIPTQLTAYIAVNGSQQVTISNPQLTVGFVQPGLLVGGKTANYLQCNNLNASLISSSTSSGVTAGPINLTVTEGFASSFKARSYQAPAPATQPAAGLIGNLTSIATLQNVPGFPYNSESGFVSTVTGGAVSGAIGVADTGTRIEFDFAAIGAGVNMFVPSTINLTLAGSATLSGGVATLVGGATSISGGNSVSVTGSTASVIYEVMLSNPSAVESFVMPVSVAYISNTSNNLPAPGTTTVAVNFSPLSTVPTASTSAPIPRFCQPYAARNLFSIVLCQCDLLFPFVTNQAGFDTGIAIANTTVDPYGTVAQNGTVKLFYYGSTTGGGAAPAAQTTTNVPAGTEVVFTLSNGGTNGVASTPGFQGYMISIANFQFCHGFAFISDVGAQKLAEGYLAIQLDIGGLNRTGQVGEVQAH